MKPYTFAERTRIVRLRIAGHHPADIAEVTERSLSEIKRLLSVEKKRLTLFYPPLKRRHAKFNDYRIETLAIKRKTMTYSEIAQELGVKPQRISFLLAIRAHRLQEGTWAG